jgi:tRNA pseudouridine38-40 synthase
MRFLKLTIAYDGTEFVGWQVQANGRSVQAELEAAWKAITGETLRVTACGRTDSGVHAAGQVCSLATETGLEPAVIQRALNAVLPRDLSLLDLVERPNAFHAIRDCLEKTYRYQIQAGRLLDVFSRRYAWHVPVRLDVPAMQQAAAALIGRHDFAAFQATGSERYSTVRTISRVVVLGAEESPFQRVTIEVTADGFLYNMVRCIAGSLVLVGQGKRSPQWLAEALQSRDRAQTGPTAPAHGLTMLSAKHQPPDAAARENGATGNHPSDEE